MKMPRKRHDLLAAILAAKEQASRGQSLRLQWRTFAADIMAVRFTKTVIDATMCHYRLFIRDLLDFAGLSGNLAYVKRHIGYIGTDSIGSLIKRFAAKKAGVGW